METASEVVDPLPATLSAGGEAPVYGLRTRARAGLAALERVRFALLVYLGSRAILFAVAGVNGSLRHTSLQNELANWDGLWYRWIANHGYPGHVAHVYSRLGFFPLYPIVSWLGSHPVGWVTGHGTIWSITFAGVIVSIVGGFVATVLVQRLATGWWGPQSARRAVLLFCLFPGSVVFSMVYAEGILIPLALGCILALERRRWLLAGILAAFATAAEPEAIVLVLTCAVVSLRYMLTTAQADPRARRSLIAPALSLTGIAAFAGYLWAHTGSPFATFIAQHDGWHERTDLLAVPRLAVRFADQISLSHFNHPTINLNLPVGLVGAALLIGGLALLARRPHRISLEAMTWTLGISFLALTSEYTPPNPRLLITAFPAVLVFADWLRGRRFAALAVANALLLAGLSALTFHGITLRP